MLGFVILDVLVQISSSVIAANWSPGGKSYQIFSTSSLANFYGIWGLAQVLWPGTSCGRSHLYVISVYHLIFTY